ncbi:MAG: hypothetical protein ACXIUQ_10395, partial [Cecembia sp.]
QSIGVKLAKIVAQIKPKSDSENWHSLNRNRWHSYTEMGGTNRTVLSINCLTTLPFILIGFQVVSKQRNVK